MTDETFWKIVNRSPIRDFIISDPSDIRVQIGKILGILEFHIPPNIEFQEHSPLLPLRFRTEEITIPAVRKFVESQPAVVYPIRVVIWDNKAVRQKSIEKRARRVRRPGHVVF